MSNEIHPGKSFPIGATTYDHGVNFCVFSRNAEYIELLLFDHVDHSKPARIIRLDPNVHRTFYYWHVFIEGLKPGQVYAYRVYSSKSTESWNQFDPRKILTDP